MPGAGRPARGAARPPPRRGGSRARDRCRDPRSSATRATSSSRLGRPRAVGSCRSRALRRVLAAVSATAVAGPRWSFEGFLPRSGRERRERLARDRRRRARRPCCSRRPVVWRRRCGIWRRPAARREPAAVCRELTKVHEQIVHGTLGELAAAAAERHDPGPRGVRAGRRRGIGCRLDRCAGRRFAQRGARRGRALVATGSARGEPPAGSRTRPASRVGISTNPAGDPISFRA